MTTASPAYALVLCSRCKDATGQPAAAALEAQLAPYLPAGGFRLETVACLAGCARPLAVAFTAPSKATFLFGDIVPKDADALLTFGRQYRDLADGWCNEGQRPAGLRGKTLARIPHVGGLAG
ncbi:DUF1636 family protein [Shinella daejeonensis]|uniref:DUF1636 family protein n=1 Tax=Shinella daejeonensis TaxID=659017 RepID=UPI0020C77B9F|nr:DUF1636 family protein [Shinella daejeonensis]MCP8894886.1 DUF1636 family protein [Shinella daejeonensis]